ncbi:MAG: response regulator [Selenomonadaceae bacterium]|nr:response regulator [Selenomonadaceae bacterium]MBR4695232.1 response regulator [Selenomonadaceae bacterium]
MRILIAEDDRTSQMFLSRFLSEYGDVDVATDGMEALDFLMDAMRKKERYDLLCLDIMMPKVSGIQVLKVIRTMEEQHGVSPEEHLPIIMMTALTDMDYVNQAFNLGCDAYASKPIEIEKVEEVMRSLGLIE